MRLSVLWFVLFLEIMYALNLRAWLKRLDESICKSLENGYGNNTLLLQKITTYNGYLYHLANTDRQWTADPHRKLWKIQILKYKSWLGPRFLTVNYTNHTLKGKLKLTDFEIKEMKTLFEETKCLFEEVEEQAVVKKVLDDLDSNRTYESYRWYNW